MQGNLIIVNGVWFKFRRPTLDIMAKVAELEIDEMFDEEKMKALFKDKKSMDEFKSKWNRFVSVVIKRTLSYWLFNYKLKSKHIDPVQMGYVVASFFAWQVAAQSAQSSSLRILTGSNSKSAAVHQKKSQPGTPTAS